MKFSLTEIEKKEFQKDTLVHIKFINNRAVTDRHWDLFWKWLESDRFPTQSNLQDLVSEYFNDLFDPSPIVLSDREFIKQLGELYLEHRSDIFELTNAQLEKNLPADWKTYREHRHVTYIIPRKYFPSNDDLKCEYDTLTGHLEVSVINDDTHSEEWVPIDGSKYED